MPGRLPDLLARFKNLTLPIWERHQIRQVGFWTVVVGKTAPTWSTCWPGTRLARGALGAFAADPECLCGRAVTQENGQVVASASDSLLRPTEFSAIQGWPA